MKISLRPDDFKDEYLKYKQQYYSDWQIADKMFISKKTLYRWKKAVGIFETRKGWGIVNDHELRLSIRIAEALNMELEKVHNTEFIKLLGKMVDKLEAEKNRMDVLPTICSVAQLPDVDTNQMTFREYQEMSKRTMPEVSIPAVSNYAMGLAGEVGEVVDLLKKHIYHFHELNKLELKKELGDVLHYLAGLCTYNGLTLEDVATTNLVKLGKRYPNGFSVERSVNRCDN